MSGRFGGLRSPIRGMVSPECSARAAVWLRARHPAKAAHAIAAATGGAVSAEAAKKWLAGGEARPSFLAFCALIMAYGPEFLAATLGQPPRWLDAAARAEEATRLAGEIDRLAERRAALIGGGA